MKIIAHRGLWKDKAERNSLASLEAALQAGYGIETDLRAYRGKLFISHDPILDPNTVPRFEELLQFSKNFPDQPMFLNIKEDGLLPLILEVEEQMNKNPVVFFDMSVPELYRFSRKLGPAKLCTRLSDYETHPSGMVLCDWLWVDGFERELREREIRKVIDAHPKRVGFASPELHGRDRMPFWKMLNEAGWLDDPNCFVCTDYPELFQTFVQERKPIRKAG